MLQIAGNICSDCNGCAKARRDGCVLALLHQSQSKVSAILNKETVHPLHNSREQEIDHNWLRAINRYTPALLADLLAFALLFWLLPPLSAQFQNLGFMNTVLMGLFFLIFCAATVGLKKLRVAPSGLAMPQALLEKRFLAVLGVITALAISIATAYIAGFLDSVIAVNRGLLDEPSVALYLLLTPASWFGIALIFMLILTTETEATIEPTTARYGLVSFLSLLGVNLMGVVIAATWAAVWARFTTVQAGVFVLALQFLLFLLLLGAPRLIYLSRVRQLLPAGTLLLFVAYLALISTPL